MVRFLAFAFVLLFLVFAFSQQPVDDRSYAKEYLTIDSVYRHAELLSADPGYSDATAAKEEAMNREALLGFLQIIPSIEKAKDDSLAFHCYYKAGVLLHYFDSLPAAKENYIKAIAVKSRLPYLADSFLFKPYLFIGGIQYNLNQFDSALIHFKKAEEIAARYAVTLDGINRLYNTLGAMYFEKGNYRQAKNYFGKAMALLGIPAPNSSDEALLINYKINLAATLTRLEEYDEANTLYQELLKQDINKNEILHNVGTINLHLGAPAKAIGFFRQVAYTNNRTVRLLNDIGQAFANMHEPDSARYYYGLALAENKKWNRNQKNIQAGLSLKYLGDIDLANHQQAEAVKKYQDAITHFVPGFNEKDLYKNPAQYSGVFSYINLFHTLIAKAEAFERWYEAGKTLPALEGSLAAYQAAFQLADHVERTYDSDEARLFLNKIKYNVHNNPIVVCLRLYELTQKKNFLEEAYLFDQRNKASILSLSVQESQLKNKTATGNRLFEEESSLKTSVTRLSLKAAQTPDSVQLSSLHASIRDYEIRLGKLQEEIKKDPAYGEKHLAARIPSVTAVQALLDKKTTLISYHLSEVELTTLIISHNVFDFVRTPIDKNFFAAIDSFKFSLHDLSPGNRYSGQLLSMRLYNILIASLPSRIAGARRLIIIPDDELHYLPFEALQDKEKKFLIEKYSVQYLYSTALLQQDEKKNNNTGSLAFAPFASKGLTGTSGTGLVQLPASKDEVSHLQGKVFIDEAAIKNNFMQAANQYGIIHLATHAYVNNEDPRQSFIAFYPADSDDHYKLFSQEIYDMRLDSTQLVILSACETGSGQLVKGEGLMSLSRAFAYAGCPSIITSLWKAEDKTTAFLTRRLHYYLSRDMTNDLALQKAKLDLLSSAEIEPSFKTPGYWAHLIFIGQYEPVSRSYFWWWIIGAIVLASLLVILVSKYQLRKRTTRLNIR
ncbi:MAG: CHAT domain-containing protein [Chitinophagaceae bacterium]|nr:CHAT domain-containing protein [Chitinophagaceae bacterium]